jgi:hypothetical protein
MALQDTKILQQYTASVFRVEVCRTKNRFGDVGRF